MQTGLPLHAASPHVRARYTRRRGDILRAALGAFREHGYQATTLDAIATRLGMRKTALYHYFSDKESILHACHRESLAELRRIAAEARALESPQARLRHLIVRHVRAMAETLDGAPLVFEVAALAPERRDEVMAGRDAYEREVRSIIEEGIRAGAFRAVDSKVAAFAILGAINWVTRWYRADGGLGAAALGAQFADHLVGGLLDPRAAERPARKRAPR